jgi:signal transduction histidine kinase
VRVTKLELPSGTVFLTAAQDVSERRAAERARQEFLALVCHELGNPLTTILGYTQILQRRGTLDEPQTAIMVRQAHVLHRLLQDLQDASLLDVGQLQLQRVQADLVELVRDYAAQSGALSPVHTIRIEAPEVPLEGWWDRDRLGQVLGNLLSNAIKYSPEGGEILVEVESLGEQARIAVTDQGLGMAPEAISGLFQPFHRLQATAQRAQGLGLGLYVARAIVEAHGGQIAVQSEPGQGSTFTVTLPRQGVPET